MWFFLSLIGYGLLAAVVMLDKVLLAASAASPAAYTVYSTIGALLLPILLWNNPILLSGSDWWVAAGSGIAFGVGLLTLFLAVRRNEATHIAPFGGAVLTVAITALSFVFLGERLGPLHAAGVAFLAGGSALFSFEVTRHGRGRKSGYWWIGLSAVLFAVSHLASKALYTDYDFLTAFVWSKAPMGLVGLGCLLAPGVRRELARMRAQSRAARRSFFLIIIDKIAGIAGNVALQYAMAIGSVTIVNALAGAQYVCIFLAVVFFTRRAPRIFREYFTRREMRMEIAGLVLVVVGTALVAV